MHIASSYLVIDCNAPPVIENATTYYTDTHYNSTALVECNEGYDFETMTGTKAIECTETGEWTAVNDVCVPQYPRTTIEVTTDMARDETAMTTTVNPVARNSEPPSPHSVSSTSDVIADSSFTTLDPGTSTLDDLSTVSAAAAVVTTVNDATWNSDSVSFHSMSYTSDIITDTSFQASNPGTVTPYDLSTIASETRASTTMTMISATTGSERGATTFDMSPVNSDSVTDTADNLETAHTHSLSTTDFAPTLSTISSSR